MTISFEIFDPLTSITLVVAFLVVGVIVHHDELIRRLRRVRQPMSERKILAKIRELHRQLCVARGLPMNPDITSIPGCPEFSMLLENAVIDQHGSLILTHEPWENWLHQ